MVQFYLFSSRSLQCLIAGIMALCRWAEAVFVGLWIGVLNRSQLHRIDEVYYNSDRNYQKEEYNRQGLWPWEQEMIDQFFPAEGHLLLGGAGGGREVLALAKQGFRVEGFECHTDLVQFANHLLTSEGLSAQVSWVARDKHPQGTTLYDGVIVGWGAYMLIQGSHRRIAFLKGLRERVALGAPLLVSFFARSGSERRYSLIAGIGNAFRKVLRRELLEVGDDLAPNYVHFFVKDQINQEFQEAGFRMVYYGTRGYGHAAGKAE